MDLFNKTLVVLHVIGGLLALVMAPLAMATRKGAAWHRRWGRIYYWAMMWVMVSAVTLSFTKRFVFFLVAVTVLSFYSTFTGVRCLVQKGGVAGNARGRPTDWAVTGAVLLFALGSVGYGLFAPGVTPTVAILCVVFSSLLLADAGRDAWRYLRPSADPKWWWYYHMQRMLGSWIAGLTAFAVSQVGPRVPADFQMLVWLGPSIVVSPAIVIWVTYYKRKFSAARPAGSAASSASPA